MAQSSKNKITCVYHPEKSGRKCFSCGTPVCKECEITIFSKPFCSWKCVRRELWQTITTQIFKKSSERWYKKTENQLKLVIAIFVVFLVVLFSTILWHIKQGYIEHLLQEKVRQAGIISPQDKFSLQELPDAMVTSSRIDISGEAADSLILSIKVNGKMQAVLLPTDGKFTFKDIELQTGSNELQVIALDASGKSKILHTLHATYGTPRLDWLARNITRGNTSRKQISLTFDGGSGNGAVNPILTTLHEKGIKTTIFLTGRFIQRYPQDVLRMLQDGHEIGNHTWSHPHLTTFEKNFKHDTVAKMDRQKVQSELVRTSEKFTELTHQEMSKYWRAPYGEHNMEIRRWASELGYQQIGWTVDHGKTMDTMDWVIDTTAGTYYTSAEILDRLIHFGDDTETRANGGIVLMHLDSQRQTEQAFKILPAYIDSMRARGYEFVSISKLLGP